MSFQLVPFDSSNRDHLSTAAALWTAACGAELAISARFVEFNTLPSTGGFQEGRLARLDGEPRGFVLASVLKNFPNVSSPEKGWIDAVAVSPESHRRGIGSALLEWAEEWLRAQGCHSARLGASLRPFAPGLPDELHNENFFRARGYGARAGREVEWDVARDLDDYVTLPFVQPTNIVTRAAQPQDESALREFFLREFPGRWHYEFEEHLREGGRISDYTILVSARGVDGFCFLTFEDSLRPLDRFYLHALPRPWGQAGALGVSADARGKHYGAAVVDAGLRRLRERGVRGCVIDWTSLLEFYGKFGFKPYRQYLMLSKSL